jgi:hypothetical protein
MNYTQNIRTTAERFGMRVNKMLYSKNEFKAKCVRMNQFYMTITSSSCRTTFRNQINCLEGPLTVNTYQRNIGLHRQFHQTPNTGSCLKQLEQILSLDEISHIRSSQIQKGFRLKKDEDYKLKVILMADTKCVLEYLLVIDSLLANFKHQATASNGQKPLPGSSEGVQDILELSDGKARDHEPGHQLRPERRVQAPPHRN